MTDKITIGKIETRPEYDPYVNIEGVVSRTFLKLDPSERVCWATQEYQTNSSSMAEWNGLILTWHIPGHPNEATMRRWIESGMERLADICDGFEIHWNGNSHVGRLNEEAREANDAIEYELENDGGPNNYYEAWGIDEYLDPVIDEIDADSTDEELTDFAAKYEPENNLVISSRQTILDYATQRRDDLRHERYIDELE